MNNELIRTLTEEGDALQPYPDKQQIKQACLRLLTRREHSRKEIAIKLAVKGYDNLTVSSVIAELVEGNWQDDSRYAESYARVRCQKGFGPVHIAHELKQQGVAPETIDNIIWSDMASWHEVLERVYAKKYPHAANNYDEQTRRTRFLLQRGFTSTMIQNFFKNHLKTNQR